MPRVSITVKYSLLVLFGIVGTSGLLSWFVMDLIKTEVSEQLHNRGDTVTRQLAYSTAPLLLSGDSAKIGAALNNLIKEKDILAGSVLDADGRVVAASEGIPLGEQLQDALIARKVKTCSGRIDDLAGERLVFLRASSFSDVRVGCVVIQVSRDALQRALAEATRRVLFLTAVIAMVVMVLSFLTLRRTLRPLSQVIEGTQLIAQGDFSTRLSVRSKDEIGDLAQAFNGMAAKTEMFFRYLDKSIAERLAEDESLALPGGTLKQVSVLFGDMRNFTSLSNERTPVEMVRILNAYFDLFFRVVDHFKGVVDKTMGDAIMAFFEPLKSKDISNSERAIMAAVGMRSALTVLNETLVEASKLEIPVMIEPCQFGFGVATGRLIVGNIGSRRHLDYTVCGPAVNLAARLQDDARRGEVIADRFSAMDVEKQVSCLELPRVLPKGFAPTQEVTPFLITGVKAEGLASIREMLRYIFNEQFFLEYVLPNGQDGQVIQEQDRISWLETLMTVAQRTSKLDSCSFLVQKDS